MMIVRSLGMKKVEVKEKPKIVILEYVQPLLAAFDELASNDLFDNLLLRNTLSIAST